MRSILIVLIFPFSLQAQMRASASDASVSKSPTTTQTPGVLNQLLFSEGDSSWTQRDFQLYKKVVSVVVKKQRLSIHTDSDIEDFIASRLLLREAEQFDLQPIKLEYQYQAKGELAEFSKAEVAKEIKYISLAMSLLELKEKQMSQKARFRAWVDVLKRKYAIKIKAQDVVPAT